MLARSARTKVHSTRHQRGMAKEKSCGMIKATSLMGGGQKVKSMEMENISSLKAEPTTVNIKTTRCMDAVCSHGQMGIGIMETISSTKKMDKVLIIGKKKMKSMKVLGKLASSMEKVK